MRTGHLLLLLLLPLRCHCRCRCCCRCRCYSKFMEDAIAEPIHPTKLLKTAKPGFKFKHCFKTPFSAPAAFIYGRALKGLCPHPLAVTACM